MIRLKSWVQERVDGGQTRQQNRAERSDVAVFGSDTEDEDAVSQILALDAMRHTLNHLVNVPIPDIQGCRRY